MFIIYSITISRFSKMFTSQKFISNFFSHESISKILVPGWRSHDARQKNIYDSPHEKQTRGEFPPSQKTSPLSSRQSMRLGFGEQNTASLLYEELLLIIVVIPGK